MVGIAIDLLCGGYDDRINRLLSVPTYLTDKLLSGVSTLLSDTVEDKDPWIDGPIPVPSSNYGEDKDHL